MAISYQSEIDNRTKGKARHPPNRKMRIAVGCIGHETNTFSLVPTTIDSFKKREYFIGEEMFPVFRNTNTIMGGYMDAAEERGMELVPLLWTFAIPSGIVEQSAYDTLKSEFMEILHNAGNLDGVLLDLHGAMAVEEIEDGEADLIAAVPVLLKFHL